MCKYEHTLAWIQRTASWLSTGHIRVLWAGYSALHPGCPWAASVCCGLDTAHCILAVHGLHHCVVGWIQRTASWLSTCHIRVLWAGYSAPHPGCPWAASVCCGLDTAHRILAVHGLHPCVVHPCSTSLLICLLALIMLPFISLHILCIFYCKQILMGDVRDLFIYFCLQNFKLQRLYYFGITIR